MRKVIASAVAGLALGAMSAVSAVDIGAGIMGSFSSDFGGGITLEMPAEFGGRLDQRHGWVGGGFKAFLDVTYAEISVGTTFGGGTVEMDNPAASEPGQPKTMKGDEFNFIALNLGLLGKFPIELSDNMVLFPAVGIDYQYVLSGGLAVFEGTGKPSDNSAIWFKFGAGMDIALTEKMFFRSTLLYGIRLANELEKDAVDLIPAIMWALFDLDMTADTRLGHGLTVNLGIGFKF